MKGFDFNLERHLNDIYSSFPEAPEQPLIGITANYISGNATLIENYYTQVVKAGGTPVLIPPVAETAVIANTVDRLDGLILTGGGDINPLWAGEEPALDLGGINEKRDLPELLTARLAANRQLPILGICRGMQVMAVIFGGKVAQDIAKTQPEEGTKAPSPRIKHSQDAPKPVPTHTVSLQAGSLLNRLFDGVGRKDANKETTIYVNSFHHQAVSQTGPRFKPTAFAPDGIIEGMESTEHKAMLGVQWHPEWLGEEGRLLFAWLVEQAAEHRSAKHFHHRHITLDSHCDTPMFFPKGIRFERRDTQLLVDLHKMTDGREDVVTMAAYLPQPQKAGQTFAEIAPYPVQKPSEYANLIFDKIESIVANNAQWLSLARTPADVWTNKRAGKKSIMLAIENGLAIETDLSNIAKYAARGIVYITLCHNGDNLLCGSAKGAGTHGGVTDFGSQAIKEMNRHGVMVDVSHASESTFYDTLDISELPVVCSHSNCRDLCDVPRNLSDDQLRALASKGGVCQITLYHGFLASGREADIEDAFAHLEHAIQVAGIDHVGLGTDFDGDGGVRGLADSAALINFTKGLLRRRYSETDIAKIWGENWLRVMAATQAGASKKD